MHRIVSAHCCPMGISDFEIIAKQVSKWKISYHMMLFDSQLFFTFLLFSFFDVFVLGYDKFCNSKKTSFSLSFLFSLILILFYSNLLFLFLYPVE